MPVLSETYLYFLCGLGWIVVAWTAIGEVLGWRAAGLLIAFAFLCGVDEGIQCVLTLNGAAPFSRQPGVLLALAGVLEGGLLLEFTRRFGQENSPAKIPATGHAATASALAIVVLVPMPALLWLGGGLFPAAAAAFAASRVWRLSLATPVQRTGLRIAAAGLAVWGASTLAEFFPVTSAPPWLPLATLLAHVTAPWFWCVGISESTLAASRANRRISGWFPLALIATTPLLLWILDTQLAASRPTSDPVGAAHFRHRLEAAMGVAAVFLVVAQGIIWRRAIEAARHASLRHSETASRAKTEFLAFLSHELRTPLQTILSRAELLRSEPVATSHAAAIDGQARLLLRLVNDLLDLGTIEAGRFNLRPQPFSLAATLASVAESFRPLAAANGLALEFALRAETPDGLHGDETRLRQILGNLLGNALKYTPAGRIALEVFAIETTPERTRLIFRVSDTGPGLPADKIPQLFTLFTRLDTGATFTREGTGVGLALVRRLCELMGGSVTAANRSGGGAEFTVELPFARTEVPVATLSNASTAPVVASLHVLIAEDNTAARAVLAEALTRLGHRVATVADGAAALAACAHARFDVVVLDVNLPGIDGIEVARRLHAQPGCPRLVGCSAEAFDHVRQAALAAGMDDFLQKPVSLSVLEAALGPAEVGDIFQHLRQTTGVAPARETLTREWPALCERLARAIAQRSPPEIRQVAHYLQSSALLLSDEAMLQHCRALTSAAANLDFAAARAAHLGLEHLLAAQKS